MDFGSFFRVFGTFSIHSQVNHRVLHGSFHRGLRGNRGLRRVWPRRSAPHPRSPSAGRPWRVQWKRAGNLWPWLEEFPFASFHLFQRAGMCGRVWFSGHIKKGNYCNLLHYTVSKRTCEWARLSLHTLKPICGVLILISAKKTSHCGYIDLIQGYSRTQQAIYVVEARVTPAIHGNQ